MSPLRLTLVCALGVLLLTPQAALGGGWWSSIQVDRSTVAAGQRVQLDAGVAFSSAAAAEKAREPGRFRVYLLKGFDDSGVERAMSEPSPRNWWSLGGAEAIQVGEVVVSVADSGLGRARAAFTVPELPPATYHLMLCDAGCAEPLADVIPAEGFTVVADPATAQMARRVDRLERRVRHQARRLAGAHADADRAGFAARSARSGVERLERQVSSIVDEGRRSPLTPWAYAGWFVAGTLAGALALLVFRRRRSRPPRSARVGAWHPTDEELRELLNSETRIPARSDRRRSPDGRGTRA
jgi:hypothetical protein